jgi:hypothetical protein
MRNIREYGYYIFGNRIFYDRQSAFDYGIAHNIYDQKIYFCFNDWLFDKIDWAKEVPVTLSQLYTLRAKQLRDKYNYLVLSFSGGSDSTQALMSFVRNGIFLDEVVIATYELALQKIDRSNINEDLEIFLEYELSAKPILDEVHRLSPKTKITILDLSEFSYNKHVLDKNCKHINLPNEANKYHNNTSIVPTAPRYHGLGIYEYVRNNVKHNNTALIKGVDKPALRTVGDELFFNFYDIAYYGVHNLAKNSVDMHFDIENFFWSADCPFIPVKQSQIIKSEVENNPSYAKVFFDKQAKIQYHFDNNIKGYSPAWELERTYNNIIYPDWNTSLFTAPKPSTKSSEFALWETLGYKHNGEEVIKDIASYVDQRYGAFSFKSQLTTYVSSKRYSLGKIKRKVV